MTQKDKQKKIYIYTLCEVVKRVRQEHMLEGRVEESRVVVRRRRAVLVRLPITWQDRRVVVTETCGVTAQERCLFVPTLSEGKEPEHNKKKTHKIRVIILVYYAFHVNIHSCYLLWRNRFIESNAAALQIFIIFLPPRFFGT